MDFVVSLLIYPHLFALPRSSKLERSSVFPASRTSSHLLFGSFILKKIANMVSFLSRTQLVILLEYCLRFPAITSSFQNGCLQEPQVSSKTYQRKKYLLRCKV